MASKQGYCADLKNYVEKRLEILLNGKRTIVGRLRGYDQFMNLVMEDCSEVTFKGNTNEKELNEYRDNIKNYINSLNTENLRTDQIEKINDLKSEYLEKLDLATSKADMDNLKQEVETKYDTIINSSTPNPSNDGCNCKTASAIVITLTTAITLLAFVLRKKK